MVWFVQGQFLCRSMEYFNLEMDRRRNPKNFRGLTSKLQTLIIPKLFYTSKTRLGCGTKSMLTFPAADIVQLYEIISNDALILRQKAD